MKKIFLCALLVAIIIPQTYAQDSEADMEVQAERETTMLPKAGDIAIGFEAEPILRYAGNILNFTADNAAPELIFLDGATIFGKYFLANDAAVRVRFQANINSGTEKGYVADEQAQYDDPLSRDVIVDARDYSSQQYLIGADYEMRRGYDRLQGYYGGGAFIGLLNEKESYTYGNAMSVLFPDPDTYDFGTNVIFDSRVLEAENDENSFMLGLNFFVGVEYFILPKISIGGELGYSIAHINYSTTSQVIELWDGVQAVEETTMQSPGGNQFQANTVNPSLGFYFMFHF